MYEILVTLGNHVGYKVGFKVHSALEHGASAMQNRSLIYRGKNNNKVNGAVRVRNLFVLSSPHQFL